MSEIPSDGRGERVWRSLDELADTPRFRERLHREFPRFAAVWDEGIDRRRFLQVTSASLAMAGLTACTKQPPETIVPYVRKPEEIVPGKPLFYATATSLGGYATGVLAESHMGRPTKIEGNPDHPASLGGTDLFAQASVLDLYDPDRAQVVTQLNDIRSWPVFVGELALNLGTREPLGGEGLRLLTGALSSPTLIAQIAAIRAKFPRMRWHVWEPAGREAVAAGAEAAFGEPVEVRYDLTKANVVLALDADFLCSGPGAVRYSKDFAGRRRVHTPEDAHHGMSRLYAVDVLPTGTSAVADHRLALPPAELGRFVVALAAELEVGVAAPAGLEGAHAAWLRAVADDLRAHPGRSLVVVGDQAEPELHTLVHAINEKLGNLGTTMLATEPVLARADGSLAELAADMAAGRVDTLIMLDVNPVYDAPPDLNFIESLRKSVRWRAHVSSHRDETTELCQWHVPLSHPLECWGDGRAFDGTVTIAQPLILPLYESKCATEVLAAVLGDGLATSEMLVREHWKASWQNPSDFDRRYRRALHDGLIADSALPLKPVAVRAGAAAEAAARLGEQTAQGLELTFRPDPTIFDGRFANNGWLQECPKPLTKLTWDNALLMSPKTARELGFGDLVEGNDQWRKAPVARLTVGAQTLELPVWVVPGHAEGALTLHLGYGRTHGGAVANGAGFNAYPLRTSAATWRVSTGVAVEPTGGHYRLASTQDHHSMEGRELVRTASLAGLAAGEPFTSHGHHLDTSKSLMSGKDFPYDGYAWGMTVDLAACTGCNACVIACHAENNIPVVGKDQVARGREMHWIRIDRYYQGETADEVSAVLHQPVFCQQCEQAPCEVVCPVAATVHSDEGLNDMVYNRCVGTRYCSNNCPYKVRRFNFLLYQDFETPQLQLGRNPDVTIRSRGVMEKCTYCVQRINKVRIDAKREGRKIKDGEIQTACQQVCPSDALVFGDVNDPASRVSKSKASPLDYNLLDELGTRPRTTYLARLRNPNPALEPVAGHGSGQHGAGRHGEEQDGAHG